MKIDLHPIIDEHERFFVPVSEFSFAAYPVQINHGCRSLPDAASAPDPSRNLWRSALRRRISQWLRWACGKPAAAPAAGDLSLEQAVP
jgi:hypothetical protein